LSCFILHNISKYLGDAYDDLEDDADGEDDMVQEHAVADDLGERQLRLQGQQKRDEVAAFLFNQREDD
jgi:hypothetical protein